jgi:hypothetical protein
MTRQSRWLALSVVATAVPALQATAGLTWLPPQTAPPSSAIHAPNPMRAPDMVLVPAGTALNVRLSDAVDVDATQAGATVTGRLDDPIMIDGSVVIPRGAAAVIRVVNVKQSGRLKGSDHIALTLHSISFGEREYDVVTEYAVSHGDGEGERTARKVGGGAALGAIIGAIADGGDGAAIGAVVGGIAGTIVAASAEEHLKLPAETHLQFTLAAALRVER